MLILGVFLTIKPITSTLVAVYLLSIFILIDGIAHIVSYFKTSKEDNFLNFEFTEGILSILSGILMIICAKYLVTFLPILIGIWIIMKSIIKMQISLNIRAVEQSNWILALIFSIISLVLGIFILFNPRYGYLTISLIGILLVVDGILNIIESAYTLYKLK